MKILAKLRPHFPLLLVACLFAQDPVIKTTVPLVVIPVSVTDQRGNFVYDLLDAVAKGIDLLASRPKNTRSLMLIIGESKDRGSETELQELLPAVQRSGVIIYCLSYSAYLTPFTTRASEYSPPQGGNGWIVDSISEAVHATAPNTGKLLVAVTGGRQLKFETKSKLENALIRLGGDIHSRYILSFSPREGPGFHNLTVEIPGRPGLQIESRPGYWNTESPAAAPSDHQVKNKLEPANYNQTKPPASQPISKRLAIDSGWP